MMTDEMKQRLLSTLDRRYEVLNMTLCNIQMGNCNDPEKLKTYAIAFENSKNEVLQLDDSKITEQQKNLKHAIISMADRFDRFFNLKAFW